VIFSINGETFNVNRDTGAPVGPYAHQFPFTGKIQGVTLEQLNSTDTKTTQQKKRGRFKASLASQ
jgi:hypothetical protein